MRRGLRREAAAIAGWLSVVATLTVCAGWFVPGAYDPGAPSPADGFVPPLAVPFLWLFAVMLWCAFSVVRHADALAELLGEPLGTLILTLSVVGIEVSVIAAVMLTGDAAPTLARDTMFAILMIVLNGLVGLALLTGGLRHHEQSFNLRGATAFLSVLTALAGITLMMPSFTRSTEAPTLTATQGAFFGAFTILLYAVFLGIQTGRHRGHFVHDEIDATAEGEVHHAVSGPIGYHAVLLVLSLLPIVILSKKFAVVLELGLVRAGLPAALGGLVIAVLVLSSEGMSAIRSALANRLQRSVNLCLGSGLSTIGLTVPAVVVIGLLADQTVVLGLEPREILLLALTLFLSFLTFGAVRTTMLQGAVHLILFLVYVVLIFDP